MGLWKGLMRGMTDLTSRGPASYLAGGRTVCCPHCESDRFVEGRTLMNTPGMTFMNLDWANRQATTLMCDRCGLVQWFGVRPSRQTGKPRDPDDWSNG
ncbi:hypothetical protein [Paludisphaera mucosa]|uniref:DNA-binding protein n=1 Tax=Paludisphaera mucosa TaxID=3030827 RepID=A0ABT6FAW2_9BACT|nr:hypothetical protein [Paludisphaera mucosa]MDG3004667.1 hypothetical protein [Paludisphaera mucosa]